MTEQKKIEVGDVVFFKADPSIKLVAEHIHPAPTYSTFRFFNNGLNRFEQVDMPLTSVEYEDGLVDVVIA